MIPTGTISAEPLTRSDVRRQSFVDAACETFFANGYAGTTMSSIAAKVGGSKTTLWTYFPSKQDIFAAVVDDLVERFGAALDMPLNPDTPLIDALRRFGHGMMGIVVSPQIVALNRLVMGEAGRFPELGTLLYERGPKRGKDKLTTYLTFAMANNRVRKGDPRRAAHQFTHLCQSGCFQPLLLGLIEMADPATIADDVEAAVDTFLRAWAV
jgi:TetR/AcrR family transcriptional regulator, mexJK operon transcriptional repressor